MKKNILFATMFVLVSALLVLVFYSLFNPQYSPPELDREQGVEFPDLVVERVSGLSGFCSGESLRKKCFIVKFSVSNAGEGVAEKNVVLVGITNGDGYAEREIFAPELLPGERYSSVVEFEVPSDFDYVSVVVADKFDEVKESDEENNVGMVR